ncbi:2Fe-2S iron-sulfur cluster binding domain-containing protein [Aestuariicella hydrocarbonica]|uniref:2Fe-2S iron-sulfur cluster binding domain-containing protein n=2 Tax=Pseudomaricurvus hydrocarbonicus TaxID=1470433 RepID=A0A9E5T1A0_9GAMM|nr:2Fe-2S iron-sulfur cluster binding domain-containing protein [Aestuariicella hydrocarbonica]
MSSVFVVDRSGQEEIITIEPGETLMQAISNSGMPDMLALCGGVCACATCHVYIDAAPESVMSGMDEDEDVLLGGVLSRQENSRLCCQIRLTEAYDGLRVTIAPEE